MEVEKNVTRTVEDFEINNQGEASSETLLSRNPHTLLEDSLTLHNSTLLYTAFDFDRRPSTAEAPPIVKIHLFSKMAVTFEPVIRF